MTPIDYRVVLMNIVLEFLSEVLVFLQGLLSGEIELYACEF